MGSEAERTARMSGKKKKLAVAAREMLVWVSPSADLNKQVADVLARWLDELPAR
jgi:hypothetical protein